MGYALRAHACMTLRDALELNKWTEKWLYISPLTMWPKQGMEWTPLSQRDHQILITIPYWLNPLKAKARIGVPSNLASFSGNFPSLCCGEH